MSKEKLIKERKFMIFLAVASFIVFVASFVFLWFGIKRDDIGGSFIWSMLIFISTYGFVTFIIRSIKYASIAKVQKAILDDNVKTIYELEELFNKKTEEVEKDVNFLINNGYLDGYEIVGNSILSEEECVKIALQEKAPKVKLCEHEINEAKGKKPPKRGIRSDKCPNCGAKVKFEEGKATCPYCGNTLNRE